MCAVSVYFRPLTESDAYTALTWRYDGPLAIYNLEPLDLLWLLDPDNGYYAIISEQGDLCGMFCLGQEARVWGGMYDTGDALDLGMLLAPVLVGKGQGASICRQLLHFASREYAPQRFRVTIAQFNQRAVRLFSSLGFQLEHTFTGQSPHATCTFVQMIKRVE
jgi:RimJ/RimL family protein N-acetyltransferase